MMRKEINVLGLTRESSNTISNDIKRTIKAFERFNIQNFYILESDSTDNTLDELRSFSSKYFNLQFKSYGNLALEIPNKIERLCFLRNELLNYLKTKTPTEYIAFIDLDNINNKLTNKSIDSCFVRDDWSGCFPNQQVGYYDIFALRSKNWNEVDCFAEIYKENLNTYLHIEEDYKIDNLFEKHVLRKMKKIKPTSDWIEVQSAFGGIGIYKYEDIKDNYYDLTFSDSEYGFECEHVNFNKRIINNGGKLYINPKFINSRFNEHNKRLKKRLIYLDKVRKFISQRNEPFNL